MDDHVVVRTFESRTEAQIAASRLEAAEIRVNVINDALSGISPNLGPAVGGFKIQVHETQADRAREILADERDGDLDPSDLPDEVPFDEFSEEEQEEWEEITGGLRCPECGGKDVGLEPITLWGGTLLFFGAMFSGPIWPAALAHAAPIALCSTLFVAAVLSLRLHTFPYACKECQHAALRSAFDPTTALNEADDASDN